MSVPEVQLVSFYILSCIKELLPDPTVTNSKSVPTSDSSSSSSTTHLMQFSLFQPQVVIVVLKGRCAVTFNDAVCLLTLAHRSIAVSRPKQMQTR